MKRLLTLACTLACLTAMSTTGTEPKDLTKNFVVGSPQIQSINALDFGPEGILFVGDSRSAKIWAIDTKDNQSTQVEKIELAEVDKAIASLLGTSPENITIQDMAVNPKSKKVYFAVHHSSGTPVLLTLEGGEFAVMSLEDISFSEVTINKPVAEDAADRRGRPLRKWAISDLNYYNGQIMVSGLSNEEFGSTFRSIYFPFEGEQRQSSLEIYHVAHGQYETHSPIKTFTPTILGGEPHIIASYTCTPLVVFPMRTLIAGQHVKGRTIAELGNWNTPLDMITMNKGGKSYLLLANSSRALMKISYEKMSAFKESLTEPIGERSGTAGVDFVALPFVNVQQLDQLNQNSFLMLQRLGDGKLNLRTQTDRWL